MSVRNSKSKPQDLIARSVTIVDEHGKGHISLTAYSKIGAQIEILSDAGPSISIHVTRGMPSITFHSSKKKMRLSFGCDDAATGIMLHDSEGQPAAIFGISPKGKVTQGVYKKSQLRPKKKI